MRPEQQIWILIIFGFFGAFALIVGLSRLGAYLRERAERLRLIEANDDPDDAPPPNQARPFWLHGRGSYASDVIHLKAGLHRATYRFPPDDNVQVRLIGLNGSDEVLFVKTGGGSAAFTVKTAGGHVFQIEPDGVESVWQIEIRRLI
jgi:hypothetical protein